MREKGPAVFDAKKAGWNRNGEDVMAIPSQNEMFKITLETMAGYSEFSRAQAKRAVCNYLNLSQKEQEQRTSSGVAVYESRVGWAISWLNDAGYIVRLGRGLYAISDAGRKILSQKMDWQSFCERLRTDRSILQKNQRPSSAQNAGQALIYPEEEILEEQSPIERIDAAVAELQDQIASELMSAIMDIEGRAGDTFFEKVVTNLLEKMGYGKGTVTPASNDGGIDGVIRTDPLGFNPILIQAKRYKADHIVGRPEIQGFAGALGSVTRGAFITTSRFTDAAIKFAKSFPHADIVLIDGKMLTNLMIQYNVGVSVEREIKIKQFDYNYFDQ